MLQRLGQDLLDPGLETRRLDVGDQSSIAAAGSAGVPNTT